MITQIAGGSLEVKGDVRESFMEKYVLQKT